MIAAAVSAFHACELQTFVRHYLGRKDLQSHDCKPIAAEAQAISAKSGARRSAGAGDITIELPTVFEFAVNQKIAKSLDVNIPFAWSGGSRCKLGTVPSPSST